MQHGGCAADFTRAGTQGQTGWKRGRNLPTRHGSTARARRVGRHRRTLGEGHVLRSVGQTAGWLRVDRQRNGRGVRAPAVRGRDGVNGCGNLYGGRAADGADRVQTKTRWKRGGCRPKGTVTGVGWRDARDGRAFREHKGRAGVSDGRSNQRHPELEFTRLGNARR